MAVQLLDNWLLQEQERLCRAYEDLNRLSPKEADMVFLGDSIVEYYPLGEFLETPKHLVNRGIRGYKSYLLAENLHRLLSSSCLDKIFILIGTNDLSAGLSEQETVANLERIVQDLGRTYPLAQIYLLSILPVNQSPAYKDKVHVRTNQAIQSLNQAYQRLATSYQQVEFLDVYDRFLDSEGQLRADYTTDGLHLTMAGYAALSQALQEKI